MPLVGEHGESRRPAPLVSADLLGHGRGGGDIPGAWRAPLELGDQRETRPDQGLVEGPILAACRE